MQCLYASLTCVQYELSTLTLNLIETLHWARIEIKSNIYLNMALTCACSGPLSSEQVIAFRRWRSPQYSDGTSLTTGRVHSSWPYSLSSIIASLSACLWHRSLVRNLGVYIDADLSMVTDVSRRPLSSRHFARFEAFGGRYTITGDKDAGSVARVVKIRLWQHDIGRH